ncbi:MAG TPA: MCP four helix bundle domain-containing protein [Cytophagales bacterium]|nr:MCP four helix bundle domain-containing protein [Cytophagales bacterium]
MKLTYFIQQKIKLATLLTCSMAIILVTNILWKNNLEDIDKSFSSIYNDRLIPVRDLFYVAKNLHTKELLMEQFFADDDAQETTKLRAQLNLSNAKVDSLISKYEKTYFVEEELVCLKTLKSKLENYFETEESILFAIDHGSKEAGRAIYLKEGKGLIEDTEFQLRALINVQSAVGQDLIKDSKVDISSSGLLATIQIVIVLLIGIFIYALIYSSKVVNQRSEKFNLN